ncbi:SRPBCC domain-containing protein [Phormidium tenue FACHB-886]|nr:SRPBCC domain-containing protein [Phormidium tenue FACHB-886]
MSQQNHSATNQSDREIVITRVFNTRRELVFKAWTEPEHIAQWWGPKGFTTRVDEMDVKPGGHWRYVMIGPDGTEYPSKGTFHEIVPPERIVTSDEFGEGIEQVVKVDLPQGKIVITALFEDLDGKTKLTIQMLHESVEDRRKHEAMGAIAGWNSSLDCLDEHLATLVENP